MRVSLCLCVCASIYIHVYICVCVSVCVLCMYNIYAYRYLYGDGICTYSTMCMCSTKCIHSQSYHAHHHHPDVHIDQHHSYSIIDIKAVNNNNYIILTWRSHPYQHQHHIRINTSYLHDSHHYNIHITSISKQFHPHHIHIQMKSHPHHIHIKAVSSRWTSHPYHRQPIRTTSARRCVSHGVSAPKQCHLEGERSSQPPPIHSCHT